MLFPGSGLQDLVSVKSYAAGPMQHSVVGRAPDVGLYSYSGNVLRFTTLKLCGICRWTRTTAKQAMLYAFTRDAVTQLPDPRVTVSPTTPTSKAPAPSEPQARRDANVLPVTEDIRLSSLGSTSTGHRQESGFGLGGARNVR